MAKNRRHIFVKGLGNLHVRQVDPVAETSYSDLGWLGGTKVSDVYDMEPVRDERGVLVDILEHGEEVTMESSLLQSAKAQIDATKDVASQYHSVRYFGLENSTVYKYICFELARIIPGFSTDFKPGQRRIPVVIKAIDQQEFDFQVPMYYLVELAKELDISGLQLWLDPRQYLNGGTSKVLDVSGFGRHGTLNADFATIWQGDGSTTVPTRFLRLDGVNDLVGLGDILDDDALGDFVIEGWFRIKGADASVQELFAKKSADAHEAGFRMVRKADNTVEFKISDGTASALIPTTATLLTNVWKHIAVVVERDGNGQMYLNGVANGAAVAVSTILTATNALNLEIGKFAGAFGQIDVGSFRAHRYAADALPSTIAASMLAHYQAEKAFYGL